MIDERVALREAERKGITVSDEELAQTIMSFPVFNENGQFIGEQRYRQILQSNTPPMTISEFEDGLRRDMLVSKLRNTLTDGRRSMKCCRRNWAAAVPMFWDFSLPAAVNHWRPERWCTGCFAAASRWL